MAQEQKIKTRIPHVLDDPGSSAIAKVYAQSFLDAAAAIGVTDPLVEFTSFVNDSLEPNAEFEQLLTASTLTSSQREELIERIVAPSSSELFASFLRVLARHDRLTLLRSILHFGELEQERREGKRRVQIATARDLSATNREKIEQRLSSVLSFKPVLETRSDPRLIGGMVIQIGDTVYDGSLRTRLNKLRINCERGASMKFKADEIASVIQKEIEDFRGSIQTSEIGRVLEVGDGIARVYGLSSAMSGEMVEFSNGVRGQVFNLEESSVGVIILGDYLTIAEGDEVRSTGELLSVPTGEAHLGRVVDPLGNPMDGKGPIVTSHTRPVEFAAPGVAGRQPVKEPLATGIKAVDAMTPIGRGQRELIIGDRKTGKTAVAIDAILNQKGGDVICVYVACGQRASTVAGVIDVLTRYGAMDYTVIVASSSADPAPMQYIAPYAGAAIAEHFMYQGKHTLVIYDDLSKQATAYRQLSLLMRRPPGREAYPGDVFYAHSRLLERAAKLSDELGGGSMTALPIIETLEGEVSAYIPTNVISITDGQIYLEPDLFFAGVRPAINVGISVSRVGGNAQTKATKKVAGGLRLDLAAFRELEAFAQLGTELDKATQSQLDRGYRMVELLKQPQYQPMAMADQVISIYAGTKGYFDKVPVDEVAVAEKEMLKFFQEQHLDIRTTIADTGELKPETEEKLRGALTEFQTHYEKLRQAKK